MYRPFWKWCLFLVADAIVAFLILFAHYEYPRHLVCLDCGTEQPRWLDVTPGGSQTIPLFFEMRYSPLPLPREQNVSAIAGVVLRPGEPVILKGRPNPARFWSFVFYPREAKTHSRSLPGIDAFHVELEPDGSYLLTFSSAPLCPGGRGQGEGAAKNWVNTGDSGGGIIFMRTYLPEPGCPTRLPAIYFGDRLMTPEEEWHEPRR
jgi:hypothetical protein